MLKDIIIDFMAKEMSVSESWLRELSSDDFEYQLCYWLLKYRYKHPVAEIDKANNATLRQLCKHYSKKNKNDRSSDIVRLIMCN